MTEADWLACEQPENMLQVPWVETISERKGFLFKAACCRRIWVLLPPDCWDVIDQAEMYADMEVPFEEVEAALERLSEEYDITREIIVKFNYYDDGWAHWEEVASKTVSIEGCDVADKVASFSEERHQEAYNTASAVAEKAQADLLREILGNRFCPFKQPTFQITPIVRALAQASYDERRLPSGHLDDLRLAVLSDALEDAGCTDDGILAHLRSPGPHVRGCWVIDLLLGKS